MRKSVIVLIFGGLLFFGSFVVFGVAIYHGLNSAERQVVSVNMAQTHTTALMQVDTAHFVQLAVALAVETESIKQGGVGDELQAQYRFPIRYRVFDAANQLIHKQDTQLAWDQGERQFSQRVVGPKRAHFLLESGLDKFRVPSPGQIYVVFEINPDTTYAATAADIKLKIYERVYKHAPLVWKGVGLLVAGLFVSLLGLLLVVGNGARDTEKHDEIVQNLNSSVRDWAMFIHLSTLAGYVIPLGGLILPLVLWLLKRDQHPFIDSHGREAVNFRLTFVIYYTLSFVLMFVLIGFFMVMFLAVVELVLLVIAAARAGEGKEYRYPFIIRFIR